MFGQGPQKIEKGQLLLFNIGIFTEIRQPFVVQGFGYRPIEFGDCTGGRWVWVVLLRAHLSALVLAQDWCLSEYLAGQEQLVFAAHYPGHRSFVFDKAEVGIRYRKVIEPWCC